MEIFNSGEEEGDLCLICLQMHIEDLNVSSKTLEVQQNVFNKVSKYLSSEVFYPCLQWNFIAERSSPICKNCFSSVEKVFKLHEMVEKIEQKIQEWVDSFTTEVIGHHNRLKQLYGIEDDTSSDSDDFLEENTTELVHDKENNTDTKVDGGSNEDDSRTKLTAVLNLADPSVRDSKVAMQYPGLHLKQLKIILPRLQLNSTVANISNTLESFQRPKRKAALAAKAALKKMTDNEKNVKKRKLLDNNSDTDWKSDDEEHSATDHDKKFKHTIMLKPGIMSTDITARNPLIFEIAKRFKCQIEICGSSLTFTKELSAHSSESGHNNSKLYKCTRRNCSKTFVNKASKKNHVKFQHKNRNLNCKFCSKIFTQKRALQIHQNHSHKDKMYKCDYCEKTFTTKVNLNYHKKLHTGKYLKCKFCPAKFAWNVSLKIHTQIKHNGEKHNGNLCRKNCGSKLHLYQHRRNYFKSKINKILPCAACKKIHIVEKIWDACINKHFRNDKTKGFICAICTTIFKKGVDLDNHSQITGHRNKKLFKCDVCKKLFYKRSHLRNHRIFHTKSPMKCNVCLKVFQRRCLFKDHMEWHKDPDKFKCEICGNRYSTRRSLRKHKRIHSDIKNYSCEVCKKTFHQLNEMRTHSKHCLETLPKSTVWKCNVCEDVFKSEDELILHKRIHNKEKELVPCKLCGKILRRKSLNRHLKTHNTKRLFKCNKCGILFNLKEKLKRHEISAHTDQKPSACTDDDAKLKLKDTLTNHSLKQSTEYLCDICGMSLSSPDILNVHKEIHNEDFFKRTYDNCDRKFYDRTILDKHIKLEHTNELQYSCTLCGNSYSTITIVREHMRQHTHM